MNVSSGNSISLKTIIEFYRNKLNSNSAINYGVLPYREMKLWICAVLSGSYFL